MKRPVVWIVVGTALLSTEARGQTFYQLTDLGSGIGPRLTASKTIDAWGLYLFGGTGGTVTYNNYDMNGAILQFSADPGWNNIVYTKKDSWVRVYNNGGSLNGPTDVDVTATSLVAIADRGNSRVLVAGFDGSYIGSVLSILAPVPSRPVSVAWDGGTTPLTTENLYILSETQSPVTYWTRAGGSWTYSWTYGSTGSGVGQFYRPSAICVGHGQGTGGGSVFTSTFYVVDEGNRRVVRLQRGPSGATWQNAVTVPDSGIPTDCAVDHFGNIYVTDRRNNRLLKYGATLGQLTQYGTFGTGTMLNTFAYPAAVHIPFGKASVGGQTVWQGQGRILTGERWSRVTGGVEHWLGVEVTQANAVVGDGVARVFSNTTDHSYLTVTVSKASGPAVRVLMLSSFRSPGPQSATWDGQKDDGTPALSGSYKFTVAARSAYGCYYGQPWCDTFRASQTFYWNECVPGGGGIDPHVVAAGATPNLAQWQPPPCSEANPQNVSLLNGDVLIGGLIPRELAIRQVLLPGPTPLFRVTGSGSGAATSAVAGTGLDVKEFVRQFGIRGIGIDVPAAESPTTIRVRIFDLRGRLVRELVNEVMDPGSYVIGWDGRDSSGRSAQPGVYVAMMNAGSIRGVTRLIIK